MISSVTDAYPKSIVVVQMLSEKRSTKPLMPSIILKALTIPAIAKQIKRIEKIW